MWSLWLKSMSQSILTHSFFVCLTIAIMGRKAKSPAATPVAVIGCTQQRQLFDKSGVELAPETQADALQGQEPQETQLDAEQEQAEAYHNTIISGLVEEEACHPHNPQI